MKRSPRLVWSGVSIPGVLALCMLALSAAAVHAQTPQVRYNLISIVTDDQASWSIGAYGNRDSRTPNMDRLAREGAVFTNALQRLIAWQQSIGDPFLARPHRPQ